MWNYYFAILSGFLLSIFLGFGSTSAIQIDQQFPLGTIGKSLSQRRLLVNFTNYGNVLLFVFYFSLYCILAVVHDSNMLTQSVVKYE